MKRILTQQELSACAVVVARQILELNISRTVGLPLKIHGVPRGGIPAMYLVATCYYALPEVKYNGALRLVMTGDYEIADIIIDDLVDSGKTRHDYKMETGAPFFALIEKGKTPGYPLGEWLVFPWEETQEKSIEDSFVRLLQFIGEDPTRGGLQETPTRMAKAWEYWTSGYAKDPVEILKTFEDGGENYDELVHVGHIPFYSQCEHHLAPFFGEVFFGYIPNGRIVGLSKMNRLVDVFARRLQVQERLTAQILETFCNHLEPLGAGIVVRARHLCMESRGVCHQGCVTTTSAFNGVIKEQVAARAEFFSITNAPKL